MEFSFAKRLLWTIHDALVVHACGDKRYFVVDGRRRGADDGYFLWKSSTDQMEPNRNGSTFDRWLHDNKGESRPRSRKTIRSQRQCQIWLCTAIDLTRLYDVESLLAAVKLGNARWAETNHVCQSTIQLNSPFRLTCALQCSTCDLNLISMLTGTSNSPRTTERMWQLWLWVKSRREFPSLVFAK